MKKLNIKTYMTRSTLEDLVLNSRKAGMSWFKIHRCIKKLNIQVREG